MTVKEIAIELDRNTEARDRRLDSLSLGVDTHRLLTDIINDNITEENWFLWKAICFIQKDHFDITGFLIDSICDNHETEPDSVPLTHWLLEFISDGRDGRVREFNIEVRKNRTVPVVVWKWTGKNRYGLSKHKFVRHILDGIEDC